MLVGKKFKEKTAFQAVFPSFFPTNIRFDVSDICPTFIFKNYLLKYKEN
jgi:hypothetical protein